MGWLSGWKYRKKITIDSSKVDSDLTNFPVLVSLTSSNFDFGKALSSGNDIRFTESDGVTELKYERERHNSSGQLAEYWVKIPSVSSSVDTYFYMYYGNSSASDGSDATNVWASDTVLVTHMNDNPNSSSIKDSSSNANNGTKYSSGQPTETDAKIARGQSFDGSDDYISITDSSSLNITGNVTLEAWVKLSNTSQSLYATAISLGSDSPSSGWGAGLRRGTSQNGFYIYIPSSEYSASFSSLNTNWHHLVGVRNGTTVYAYVDGSLTSSSSCSSGSLRHANATNIGTLLPYSTTYINGIIDEVRIFNTAKSSAWIKASYHSTNNSLVSYGSEATNFTALLLNFL